MVSLVVVDNFEDICCISSYLTSFSRFSSFSFGICGNSCWLKNVGRFLFVFFLFSIILYRYFSVFEVLTFWIFCLLLVSVFLYAYSCNTASRFPTGEWPNGIYKKCTRESTVVILLPIRVNRRIATALLDLTNFLWGTYRTPIGPCLRKARMWPPVEIHH